MALAMTVYRPGVIRHFNIGQHVDIMVMTVFVSMIGCDGTMRDDAACKAASDRRSQQGCQNEDQNDLQSFDHHDSLVRSRLTNALCRNWVARHERFYAPKRVSKNTMMAA